MAVRTATPGLWLSKVAVGHVADWVVYVGKALVALSRYRYVLASIRDIIAGTPLSSAILGRGWVLKYAAREIERWHKDPNCPIEKDARKIQEEHGAIHTALVSIGDSITRVLKARPQEEGDTVAPTPAWLLRMLQQAEQRPAATPIPEKIAEGGRNDLLFRADRR